MCGVESTRAPSVPRNVMAVSLVTSNWNSPLAPIGMFAIALCGRQSRQNPALVTQRALHAHHGILAVDLVFHVDAARITHFLELFEDGRERKGAVADIALAVLILQVAQILDVH